MQRLLPPTLVLVLAAMMVIVGLLLPGPGLPFVLRLFGASLAAIGLAATVAESRRFGQVGTNIKTFDDPDHLVDSGLFALSRNPMYLGFLLFLVGLAGALGSPPALVGPLLFFLIADRWYIPFEEQRMIAVFGDDYRHYRRRVRRWLGRRVVSTDRVGAGRGR